MPNFIPVLGNKVLIIPGDQLVLHVTIHCLDYTIFTSQFLLLRVHLQDQDKGVCLILTQTKPKKKNEKSHSLTLAYP